LGEARSLQIAAAMRNVACLVLAVAAGCGIQNKVAPDGELVDGTVAGDGADAGSGSDAALTIELTEKPPMLGNSADADFGLTTNKPATIECRLDDDAYHACDEHQTAAALADGMHSFDARATAGDEHAEIPTYSFAIDTRAPMLSITGTPPMSSPVATAQFHFTIDDSTTVSCQLDSQPAMTPCGSPVSYTALADGAHTFTLTGTDGAGNTAAIPYMWTVDTSHPAVAITTAPPNPSTSRTALFEFTTGNSVTVTCQLDSAAAASCGTSKTYSGLADGPHLFTLKGTNGAGTTTTQTHMWTVDASAPDVDIDTSPAPITNATAAQFTFHKGDATTVTCQLDTGTPATCTSPWTYTGLTDGSHTFTLEGTDAAGNATTKTKMWTVDTIPPGLTLGTTPPDPSTSASAQFTFMATGATAVTCRLDGAAATSCTTSASYSGLSDAMHTFTVRAVDAAANATSRSYTWSVDTTPPALTLTSKPPLVTTMTSAQLTFTTGDAVTVTCQLDGAAPASCSTSVSYSGLGDGSHTFTLRGTDAAGNTGSQTYTWSVDSTPQALTLNTYPSDPSTSATAAFTFTITGASSGTCQLDSQAATSCTTSVSYSNVADGMHTFTLRASDGAGNSATKTYPWTVDSTGPALTLNAPPAVTNHTDLSIAFTVGDSTSWTCQLDGGNQQACSTPFTATGLGNGSHSFTLRGTDAAGNTASRSATWTVDTVPPIVSITSHPGSGSHSVSISFSVSEGQPMCSLDFQPSVACSSPATYTLADGGHTFVVSTTDAAGNYDNDSTGWIIDTTKPSVSFSAATQCTGGQYLAYWTVSDANSLASGTCTYTYGTNTMTWDCLNARSASGSILGGGRLTVSYTDEYGNTGFASKNWTSLSCE
jgi:hypothetical protein